MRSKLFFKHVLISVCFLSLSLSTCLPQAGIVSTATPLSLPTESLSTAIPSSSVSPLPIGMIEVAFVKDGNIQVWDEATQQTLIIVNTGDVLSVTTSDDGQRIAFTRGSWVGGLDGYEQFALWAMNRDGGNLRELISAQDLRQRINPSERDSSNFYQLSWVPQSHQLIFSGTRYIVQGEGLSHAIPQGVYLVDTDDGSITVLAEAAEHLLFLPSPDGKQIALMSPSDVGFINTDGSNKRQDVLTYAEVGLTGPLFPKGAWTQDSRAFVVTGSFERDPGHEVNFTIWRIPLDGSSPEALAAITESNPNSVTFSPDGKSASFLQTTDQQPPEIAGWFIKPLIPEAGPLALPYYGKKASFANLHWSPADDAFAIKDQDLLQLCPNATQDSQVCEGPIHLGSGIITALEWIDPTRFLFETIEPNTLSLGKLDGTITPIVTWTELQRWTENDIISGWSSFPIETITPTRLHPSPTPIKMTTPTIFIPSPTPVFNIFVNNVAIDQQGQIYASGFHKSNDLRHYALWAGGHWIELGNGFQTAGNTLVADGEGYLYTDILADSEQGTTTAMMRWDGSRWEDITGNFSIVVDELKAGRVSSNIPVTAMAVDGEDNLYAAGMFYYSTADYPYEIPMGYVAKWDRQTWTVLGQGHDLINIYGLTVSSNGHVYVSGEQPATPEGNNCYIAQWESGKWMQVNTGDLNTCTQSLVVDKSGHLYVAGQSNTGGGFIAYWDNSDWTTIAAQLEGEAPAVYDMAVDQDGHLCIGGEFTSVSNIPAQQIACWDGKSWYPLGAGVNERVFALAFDPGGDLYAAGYFTEAGGLPAYHAARWDGEKWHALGEE